MNQIVVTVGTSLAVGLLMIWLRNREEAQRRQLMQRVDPTMSPGHQPSLIIEKKETSVGASLDQSFDKLVEQTTLDMTSSQALGLIAFVGLVSGSLFYLAGREWPMVATASVVGSGLVVVGLVLLQSRWKRSLESQLPDVLFFLARSVRTGISLEQSIGLVSEHAPAPINGEMKRVARQCQLGIAPKDAVSSFANRTTLPDAFALHSAMILQSDLGGNLATLLDQLASATRERLRLRKQIEASTSMSRTAAIMIGSAYPLILLYYYLARPEFSDRLFESTGGWFIIGISLVLEIIGIAWLTWLLRIDA